MSQHDYNLANANGAAFRADLNLLLAAIASSNAGSSGPTTTFPGMLWLNDSTGVFSIRNKDDSAWVELGDVDLANMGLLKASGGQLTGLLKFAEGASIASAATVDLSSATGNTVHITGTTPITAFTMSDGQVMDVIFDGALTLTHHATSNNLPADGANITTAAGDRARYFYDGATVWCMSYVRKNGQALVSSGYTGNSMVRLNTANGYGSTNTAIRRFTNVVVNQGSDITYADSASAGGSFTINTNGVYAISYVDSFSANSFGGISLDSNQLTTGIGSISAASRLSYAFYSTNAVVVNAWTGYLPAGSIIRPHAQGVGTGANQAHFDIARVS